MAQYCIIYQVTALDIARNQIEDQDLVANELGRQQVQANLAEHPMDEVCLARWVCDEPDFER